MCQYVATKLPGLEASVVSKVSLVPSIAEAMEDNDERTKNEHMVIRVTLVAPLTNL